MSGSPFQRWSHRLASALCLIAAIVLGFVPTAAAAARLVSPAGADGGDCLSAPCVSLSWAYQQSVPGDVVTIAPGAYPTQTLPPGTKQVTFAGAPGAKLERLDNSAENVTFDGVEIDGAFAKRVGLENRGAANVTFKNGRIGNVIDEKGALISGSNFTFDNVTFHDVRVTDPLVHNECVYAIGVPGMKVLNSTFVACATMDLFFTYGDWWTPLPPGYGNVILENNVFGHSTQVGPETWHYYSVLVGNTGPGGGKLEGWVVRNNTFETNANIGRTTSSGSRWTNNLGAWNCVAGVRYSGNVGSRCGTTDIHIRPDSSAINVVAAFGWRDPRMGDWHLTAGSPAIDAGDPADATAVDREGTPRDSRPDAGAYEYVPPPPPVVPVAAPAPPPAQVSAVPRRRSARLKLTSSRLTRGALTIRGSLAKGSGGRVTVRYSVRVDGKRRSVSRTARVRLGRFAVRLPLKGALRSSRRGTLRLVYSGTPTRKPQTVTKTLTRR